MENKEKKNFEVFKFKMGAIIRFWEVEEGLFSEEKDLEKLEEFLYLKYLAMEAIVVALNNYDESFNLSGREYLSGFQKGG
jgi:hypothetical protein